MIALIDTTMKKIFISFIYGILLAIFNLPVNVNALEIISCNDERNKKLTPKKGNNDAYEVGVGIVPLNITKFNLRESSVDIDFYLTVEFILSSKVQDLKCVGDDAKNVWKIFYNPDIEFMNIPDPQYMQGFHWLVKENRFIYMTRVKGTASIDGNFRNFPFDTTKISLTSSGEDNNEVMKLHPSSWYHPKLNSLSSQFDSVRVPGWSLKNAQFTKKLDVAEDGTGVWDLLTLEIELERKSATIVARSGLPLLMLYLVAFFSLRVPAKFLDVRIGTQAAVLLALFAYSVYFIESIPATDYLTFGDISWMTVLLAIFLIIFSELIGHSKRPSRFGVFARRYFPTASLVSILFVVIYGFYLLL